MKKLLALFLIFPIFISAEEQTFEECIASVEIDRASEAYEACFTDFEVKDRDLCVANYTETSGYTEEDALEECISLEVEYQYSLFMDDRPTEFYDMLGKESIGSIRSYACKVPKDEVGNELNNAVITYYEDDDTVIERTELPYKAIIHILDEKNYSEINFGSTIFPIAENRFFTNYLQEDERILSGRLDIRNPNPEMKGGTDRGPEGGGWILYKDKNQLELYVGAYVVEFKSQCYWNDIDPDNL